MSFTDVPSNSYVGGGNFFLLLIYSTAIFAINACDACDKPCQCSLFI